MKRLSAIILAAAVVAMAAVPALAQEQQRQRQRGGPGFGAGLVLLLNQKSVQDELKLSDEQVKKVKELTDKQREAFQRLRDLSFEERQAKLQELAKGNNKAVAEILKPAQLKRVKQISLQQQRLLAFALANPEVAQALNLSDEQKDKIKDIQSKAFEGLRGQGRAQDEEARQKREEAVKAMNEKVMGLLTAEQKTKLKELQGEPFKGEIERPQFGGGRGRRNP